jgi:hypothetical protein
MFVLNASHHLVPYNPFEKITLTQIASHSPAANIPEKKVPVVITEPEKLDAHARPAIHNKYHRLTKEQVEEVNRRLLAGEKVWDVAHHFGVTDWAIYIYRKKLGIHGRLPKSAARKQRVLKAKSEDLPPAAGRYLAIRTIIIQKAANGFILELRREESEFDPVKDLRIFPDFKTVVDWLQG